MTKPEDLTYNGFLDLRDIVARILVAGANYQNVWVEVDADTLRAAENLIAADVLQIDKLLPGVQ
ncbi:hypothetical protein SEA_BIG4_233 [Microbacterium phage Big4]|nr:hypothetical protein SEA_BIG4_233 [Microbacterium phage Big4]